jgi:hypothetical protein
VSQESKSYTMMLEEVEKNKTKIKQQQKKKPEAQ